MGGSGEQRIRDRLTRRTSGGRFIPAVDGLRFVAIALVVAFHLDLYVQGKMAGLEGAGWVHEVLSRGDTGVLLFFGISGFILGLPFARAAAGAGPDVSIGRYLIRRVTRLEPPYIVAMTVLLLAFVVVRHQSLADLLPHHLWSLGYMHNQVYDTWSPVNGVVWSLEVEVQFYLLAPVLGLVYRLRPAVLRLAAIVALALGAALAQVGPLAGAGWRVDLSLVGHLQHFLAGMLVADLVARHPAWSPEARDGSTAAGSRAAGGWAAGWWADAAGALGLALILLSQGSTDGRAFLIPLGVAACLVAALRGPIVGGVLSQPWIYVIGGMCYTIYLFHFAIISLVGPQTAALRVADGYLVNLALQAALIGIPMAMVCVAFFVLVERPCMDPGWPAALVERGKRRLRPPAEPEVAPPEVDVPAALAVTPSDHGAAQP